MPVFLSTSSLNEISRSMDLRSNGLGLFQIEGLLVDPIQIQDIQGYFLADSDRMRSKCLTNLQNLLAEDFRRIFGLSKGKSASIRLFAGSVESYLPKDADEMKKIGNYLSMTPSAITEKISSLREDPTFGIRGCRFAILHQDFLAMQIHAIFAAVFVLAEDCRNLALKIVVPMLTSEHELEKVIQLIDQTTANIFSAYRSHFDYEVGAIIETPRACLCADKIANTSGVSFVLFAIDQLTEYVLGLSKSGSQKLIDEYLKQGVFHEDPFKRLDKNGVGSLLAMGIRLIRFARARKYPLKDFRSLQIGIFGNQLGERRTVEYFQNLGVDYMICSFDYLPIVKIASAQAYISTTKEPYWTDPIEMPDWL